MAPLLLEKNGKASSKDKKRSVPVLRTGSVSAGTNPAKDL